MILSGSTAGGRKKKGQKERPSKRKREAGERLFVGRGGLNHSLCIREADTFHYVIVTAIVTANSEEGKENRRNAGERHRVSAHTHTQRRFAYAIVELFGDIAVISSGA